MMHISFFLAWRYLLGSYTTTIKTMFYICFFTITIASCALALVTFIMHGFEQSTHAALKGMHADIIMQAHNKYINFSSVKKVIAHEFPEITGCSPSNLQQGLINTNDSSDSPMVVMIKAIDPDYETYTSSLERMIIYPKKLLAQMLDDNQILMGIKLAQSLHVRVNDSLQVLIPSEERVQKNTLHFSTHTIKLGGIFKTGIEEFDSNVIIGSFTMLEKIIPDVGVSTIHLTHKNNINDQQLIKKLQNRFGLAVCSWKNLYPALVAALKLEKYAMIIMLSLMILLASMSIISLLFMIITSKQKDQTILRAMGLSKNYCSLIFMIIGIVISTSASLVGLMLACIIGTLLQWYPLIKLPDAYYVSHLPIVMHIDVILYIFFLVFLLTLCATLIPFIQNRKISIIELLKTEH